MMSFQAHAVRVSMSAGRSVGDEGKLLAAGIYDYVSKWAAMAAFKRITGNECFKINIRINPLVRRK
jgi:hypothetical protein